MAMTDADLIEAAPGLAWLQAHPIQLMRSFRLGPDVDRVLRDVLATARILTTVLRSQPAQTLEDLGFSPMYPVWVRDGRN
jgi:hypothetical protein